jgi:hypothetical protein
MVLARSCGITSVAALLAPLLDAKENTVRQRLREWCYEAKDKRGAKRQALEVSTCFAPLLRWVLAWWSPTERRLVLAMDATTLGQRFTVLTISVVYRGCAIPVAWTIVEATRKGAWRPHWEALFDHLQGCVPADWTVLVLADRLYARWLFQHLVKRGWHPFLRINRGGNVRPSRRRDLSPAGDAGAAHRPHVVRARDLLFEQGEPVGLYPAGALGRRLCRAMVDCDGPGRGGG